MSVAQFQRVSGWLAIGLVCMFGAGCTGVRTKPECPVKEGPRCLSMIEAYERTHGDTPNLDGLQDYRGREAVRSREPHDEGSRRATMPSAPMQRDGTLVLTGNTTGNAYPVSMTTPQVVAAESAYRVPATVMRVWINAWEDDEGGLHLPQKVFREVEPRRWTVGAKTPTSGLQFQLLGSATQPAKESQTVKPKGEGAGS